MKTVKEIKQYIDSKDWAEKFYKNVETLNGGRFDWDFLNVNPELAIAGKFDFTETHEGGSFWYNINSEYLKWLYDENLDTDNTYPVFKVSCAIKNENGCSIIKQVEEKDYEKAITAFNMFVNELIPLYDYSFVCLDKCINKTTHEMLKWKDKCVK